MKRRWFRAILLFPGLIALAIACCYGAFYYVVEKPIEKFEKSRNPPMTLNESDLLGTWKAGYDHFYDDGGIDTLILKADGTFKQIYENQSRNYIFETPWNEWWLERFPDGRVRVHLKGARYYLCGIREVKERPVSLHDPFAFLQGKPAIWYPEIDKNETSIVHTVGELVLNVRVLPSGELVLAHMWPSGEWAWGDEQLFHRVGTLLPPQTPAP
ncbi:MAG: hypothetical protein H5T61_14685 [Thermoflexales bacterium]|nr:hypothetical protein [Thermoflexales bacterium]